MCFARYSSPLPQSSCNFRCWKTLGKFASWLQDSCMHSLCYNPGLGSYWKLGSCYKWNGWCPHYRTCCRWSCQPGMACHRAPVRALRCVWAGVAPPSPGSGPASDACTCTSCSGTRSWPGSGSVWAPRPGDLSRGRTGIFAAWSAVPARTPVPGRRGRVASCASEVLVCPSPRSLYPPHSHLERSTLLIWWGGKNKWTFYPNVHLGIFMEEEEKGGKWIWSHCMFN